MFIAVQHSALSGFTYDLLDSESNNVGTLNWPDIAIAKNARFRNPVPNLLNSAIEIKYGRQLYQLEFEYLSRDWFNNIRFTLVSEGTVIASADVTHQKKLFKRPKITINEPFAGEIIRTSGWFTVHYKVMKEGRVLGTVSEKGGLTVKRKLFIDLPNLIIAPVQFFIFFLVHNHAYR